MTREQAIQEIKEKTPQLLADYRALAAQIGGALGLAGADDAEDDRPELDPGELADLYGAIQEFAEGFDLNSIDALLAQTKDFKIPDAEKERFEKLERCVRDSDWDKLKEVLA